MKTVGIMQPYLFPYLGYFQLVNAVDEFVVYDDVQHIKRGWVNRNTILFDGKKHPFTIALSGASTTKLINEIYIQDDFRKFIKTLETAYAHAPHKRPVINLIKEICDFNDKNLATFTTNSIERIAKYTNISTKIIRSSSIDKRTDLKGQEKIITICKKLNADRYINAIGGQELYDEAEFKKQQLDIKFIKTNLEEYSQFDNEFIPGLSIIDVMMFNSPEKVNQMLGSYELI